MEIKEILEAAKLCQSLSPAGCDNTSAALIAAAELLKQVEVLPEGEKARKDDVIDLGEFGFAIVAEVSGNNIDCAMLRDGQLMSGYFFRNFGKYPIIQRAGRPVLTVGEV